MKTGWTISITDAHAKDKIYKFVKGDRRKASTKRAEYQSRYDTIEAGRFKVELDAQYSEFSEEGSCKVKCRLGIDVNQKDLRELLSPFDVFVATEEDKYVVEAPSKDKDGLLTLLRNSYLIDTVTAV